MRKIAITIHLIFLSAFTFGQPDVHFIDENYNFTAIEIHPSGNLLCGTENGQILLFNGKTFSLLTEIDGFVSDFLVEGEKLKAITTNEIIEIGENKNLIQTNIPGIIDFVGTDQAEVLLTENNVLHKNGLSFQPDPSAPVVSETADKQLLVHEKDIYLSFDSTLYRFSTRWRLWKQLPFSINSLASHGDQIYAGTEMGLFVVEDNSLRQIVINGNSISEAVNYVFSIEDVLIYTTDDGVTFFNTKDYTEDKWRIKNTERVDIIKDHWNNYWVVVNGALVKIQNKHGKRLPPLFTEINIRQGYQSLPSHVENIILNKEQNDIGFDFIALHLGYPESIFYQYKLVGKEERWSTWTNNTSVNYSSLPPGKYVFNARTSIDKINYTDASPMKIKIKGDPVASIWYFLGGVAASLILLTFWSQYRMRSITEKNNREIDRLRTQNKMLAYQQKSLQLQMNPHFIFNALNSIQGLIDKDDNTNARNYLKQFSSLMRMVLNQSRTDFIALEDELKYLDNYLSLEQMTRNHSFTYLIECDNSVEDDLKIPPMIIQPFVENAIIHGVSPLRDRKGKINIRFRQKERYLLCEIKDNGVGRAQSGVHKSTSHRSVAISVVEDRLNTLFKNKTGENVKLIDSEDGGLLVRIKIPYV